MLRSSRFNFKFGKDFKKEQITESVAMLCAGEPTTRENNPRRHAESKAQELQGRDGRP